MIAECYRHSRLRLWSVRVDGHVLEHRRSCLLHACEFIVQQGTRQRVVDTGQRAVHAWVRGVWRVGVTDDESPIGFDRIAYNPFRAPTFTVMPDLIPVRCADTVLLLPDGSAWARDWRS